MEPQTTTTRTALKYGLIFGVVSIIYSTMLFVTGQVSSSWASWLIFAISITGMVLAMKAFRDENGGFMSYGQGLGIGTTLAVVSSFISTTYSLIYTQFIDTTINQQILDKTRTDMENRGMEDAQIDQAMAFSEKIMSPGLSFGVSIVAAAIFGFIISLVVSAIMKKEKPFELE